MLQHHQSLDAAGPPAIPESGQRVAILGGGIAGMSLASELASDNRFTVELIEQTAKLGGLPRSVEVDGLAYDIGFFCSGINRLISGLPRSSSTFSGPELL